MRGFRLFRRLIAVTLILAGTGCVSLGAKFQPVELDDKSKALVILYRPADLCNLTDPLFFHANGVHFASLENNAYTHLQAEPGFYKIEVKNMLTRFTKFDQGSELFKFEAGNTYYIKYHRICKLFAPDVNFVEAMEKEQALEELGKMGYQEAKLPILNNPKQY